MARIILTEMDDLGNVRKILIDTKSKFAHNMKLQYTSVKEPDGKLHFVTETLEEVNQMIFEAEANEKNLEHDYKKQEEMLKKMLETQKEILEILRFFVKKSL